MQYAIARAAVADKCRTSSTEAMVAKAGNVATASKSIDQSANKGRMSERG